MPTPAQLIEQLSKLPQDKSILCQIVDQTGHAFGGEYEFHDVPDSWMVQLRISHRELIDLYDIPTIAEEDAKPSPDHRRLAMLVKRVTVILGGGLTVQYGLNIPGFPVTVTMIYDHNTVQIQVHVDAEISISKNGQVVEYPHEPDLSKFLVTLLRS